MAYAEFGGVFCLGLAALLSLLSVFFYFMRPSLRDHSYGRTHIRGYFRSLLVANGVQAFGTVMNFKWAADNGVTTGTFCGLQGAIKQGGNVATALWSFVLALHLFNVLFLRLQSTVTGFWCTIIGGWLLVILLVIIGPTAIQTPSRGPYFGISGDWCWITSNYRQEQIFLEYFFEYLSALLCVILYSAVFLRMRGNLAKVNGKWSLRSLPPGESWQLSLRRDLVDYTMLHAVQQMMWYPVVYTLLIVPITIARGAEFSGANVPFWALVITDIIFNLNGEDTRLHPSEPSKSIFSGLANVVLLGGTRKRLPDMSELEFTVQRKGMRDSLIKSNGIAPFTLERSETAEKFHIERLASLHRTPSTSSSVSASSVDAPVVVTPAPAHLNGAQ
ncbi:Git3 domain-containing protein [Mycena sanguinolenta]|uniref:Git3 domain-containing protein n=1 Tax=Mycena sanguinolenta TaxID=230812 RepID=A0A8H7CID2_9AGAR|nr:Git3 domain-containing protein [Mycena sanguinolenta]